MDEDEAIPIVDSHVHLYAAKHLPSLAWYDPSNQLCQQHSVENYRQAVTLPFEPSGLGKKAAWVKGFIFVEVDRFVSPTEQNEEGWRCALDEASYLSRILRGLPLTGEGHSEKDSAICLGVVIWAPIHLGSNFLERYMGMVRQRVDEESFEKNVRGVRFILQNKPLSTMTSSTFIEGLKWCGRHKLTFDVTIDVHQRGVEQMRAALEMMHLTHCGVPEADRLVFVLDHLCKPNLGQIDDLNLTSSSEFSEWKEIIFAMSRATPSYIKLSGCFSELSTTLPGSPPIAVEDIVEHLISWTDVIFDAFGVEYVMFGSDWPVCNVNAGGNRAAWNQWVEVVEGILKRRRLNHSQKKLVWGGNALTAYSILR